MKYTQIRTLEDYVEINKKLSKRVQFYIIIIFILVIICFISFYHKLCFFEGQVDPKAVQSLSIAQQLYKKVRVLCMIITTEERHDEFAVHAKRLWAQHCNKVLFMSNSEHGELEPVMLNIPDLGDHKWSEIQKGFKYVYNYHRNDADWFLKVEDDGFVILENLRYLLYPYSPNTPIYFGCRFKDHQNQTFMHGGSGYVLSKEALRRFVTKALPNDTICYKEDVAYEDIEMGKCLRNVDVIAGDSRDKDGLNTFLPFNPPEYIKGLDAEKHKWYMDNSYYGYNNESRRISKRAISFHNVSPGTAYDLYYFIYQMRLFGKRKYNSSLADLERLDVDQQSYDATSYESLTSDQSVGVA